jgi:anti-sigma factor RsiW
MPSTGYKPSEAELHAFTDGELERARADAVQAYLAASPEDAARVSAWLRQKEALRAAFGPDDSPALPWPRPQASSGERCRLPLRHAAAGRGEARDLPDGRNRLFAWTLALGLAAGPVLAGYAAYRAGLVPEGRRPSLSDQTQAKAKEALAEQARAALQAAGSRLPAAAPPGSPERGNSFGPPVLPGIAAQGFKFAAVRAFPDGAGQTLCLSYVAPDGSDLVLCGEKKFALPGETGASATAGFPSAAVLWQQKGANYVLAGTLPEAALRRLANEARSQIDAFDVK